MTPEEKIFYAFGHLAYSIAIADGMVQNEERITLEDLLCKEFSKEEWEAGYPKIIFMLLNEDKKDKYAALRFAVEEIEKFQSWMTDDLRIKFKKIARHIANATPPITNQELDVLWKFEGELDNLILK
jgi:hypothetical protein